MLAAYEIFTHDPHTAFEEMKALAKLGSTNAAINIGGAYHHDKGVALDMSLSEFWLRQAFDKGDPVASYYLGNLYSDLGRTSEENKAYESGVACGYFPSAYPLAMNILDRSGSEEDFSYGCELLKWAAGFGHAFSIRKLASLYMQGNFGFFRIPYGLYLLFKSVWIGITVALKNIEDDRLHS